MHTHKNNATTIPHHCLTLCFKYLLVLVLLLTTHFTHGKASAISSIEWVDLIPKANLEAILNPPASILSIPDNTPEDILSESFADSVEKAISSSQAPLSLEEQIYYNALQSTDIKEEYNKKNIRIPGFIVPIEYNDKQSITEFFLVPYFGACIHVPPPPPNQIIYVKYPKGLTLEALYDPFWVEGLLQTEVTENSIAISAYALSAKTVKPYRAHKEK